MNTQKIAYKDTSHITGVAGRLLGKGCISVIGFKVSIWKIFQ